MATQTGGNPNVLTSIPSSYDGTLCMQGNLAGAGAVTSMPSMPFRARGIGTANVADLTAFTAAATDLTFVAGDRILLVAQTTTKQNGLYILGALTAGVGALTRAPEFSAGAIFAAGQTCHISEGTTFANTEWKITTAGNITVDTTSHAWYPRTVTFTSALTAGTVTISTIPVLSATKTFVGIQRIVANTCTSTIAYCPTVAGANGITAGVIGTGSIVVQACVAAGTINASDVSTVTVTVTNF